jgi:hypothetical protein
MAAISWPASLGAPMAAEKLVDDNLILTKMDAGPSKRRRRYTARADGLALTYRFDATQFAVWRAFFDTTTNDGLETYDITDPIDGGTIDVALAAQPKIIAVANVGGFDVSLQLEVQP